MTERENYDLRLVYKRLEDLSLTHVLIYGETLTVKGAFHRNMVPFPQTLILNICSPGGFQKSFLFFVFLVRVKVEVNQEDSSMATDSLAVCCCGRRPMIVLLFRKEVLRYFELTM